MYKFRQKVRKFVTFVALLSILGQSLSSYLYILPGAAYAQETTPTVTADPTPTAVVEPSPTPTETITPTVTPNPTPEPTAITTLEPTSVPTATPEPKPPQAPSQWTFEKVELNKEYVASQNSEVKLTFTKLPDPSGNIKIEEITLTKEQIQQTGSLSDKAYDITSDMADGSFTYNLSLPIPDSSKGKAVEVKFAEEISNIGTAEKVENTLTKTDTSVSVSSLDHFTIFVVTGTIDQVELVYTAVPFPESPNAVVINEFVFHPSSNNEWIELYNTGSSSANLTGWTLKDGNNINDDLTLSGTIPANGILVFESNASGWLNNLENNTNGDTITLRNSEGTIISQVTYQKGEGVTAVAGLASSFGDMSPGQSIGRIVNTEGITWQSYSTPTKGWFNDAGEVGKAPLLSTIDSSLSASPSDINSNIGELSNPSNTPSGDSGLFFEKTGKGKILFTASLNLTNQATVLVLQSLGEKMEMADGHIKFDSQTASDMAATGAKIYMYGLDTLGYTSEPDIIVKDDANEIIDGSGIVTSPVYSVGGPNGGELSFGAAHFTQFDLAVNNPPSFDTIADQVINEDASSQNVAIANVSPGTDEPDQTVTFSATSSNTSVIPNPVVSGLGSNRTLTYAPTANANGSAIITVTANDGQAQNSTYSRTFTITVNDVNDTPSFTKGDNQTISEDAGAQTVSSWATSISKGSANESIQTLSFIVTNNNNSLFSAQPAVAANGTLTYTPAANANGLATVTVSIQDNGGTTNGGNDTSATQTFTITVNAVNDAPTITVTSPNGGEIWAGGSSHAITWSASDVDNASNTLTVDLSYTSNGTDFTSIASGLTNSGTYTWNPVASLNSSTVQIKATVTDPSNATGTDLSDANFTIDSTAPNAPGTPSTTTPTNSTTQTWNWTAATDALSDIQNYFYRITGSVVVGLTSTDSNVASFITNLGEGVYNFFVSARDNAGNTGPESSGGSLTVDTTAPTVAKLGDNSADYVLSVGDTSLVFSEVLSDSSKTAVTNALTDGADKTLTYAWSGATLTITASETTTFANDVVVSSVSDVVGNAITNLLIVDSSLGDTQTTPDASGDATANSSTPNVVITNPTQPVDITIDPGTTDPTIDVSSFITGGTGDIPQITITSTAGSGNAAAATIEIPATTVTGPTGWDGVIAAPTVTTVTLPSGSTLGEAIEIGYVADKLSFDNAVRILLPNQAGKRAGYSRPGTDFTPITNICSSDSQEAGDALSFPDGDCKIDAANGLDLVIWTKHFTKFASYTQTTNSSGGGGGGDGSSGSGGGSGGSTSAPVCGNTKPGSAPRLLSAVATGTNQITLTWSKASDPVTYYLVTFGTKPGEQLYGNPNVGGAGVTSYTISNLSGGRTYYFKVRAGNGCKPGDYSNEVSGSPTGGFIAGVPGGFAAGVLGAKTQAKTQAKITPVGVQKPAVVAGSASSKSQPAAVQPSKPGFFGQILNFFKGLFDGK